MKYQPCPDCGNLMDWVANAHETGEGNCWKCSACGGFWTDQQIAEVYHLNSLADAEDTTSDDYSIYDMDEDGSYYDDDYDDYDDYDGYDQYYQTWGWRYRVKQFLYRLRWFFRRNFLRCSMCKRRYKNCNCIPF